MSAHANIATRSRDYGETKSSKAKGVPDSTKPLHITRPIVKPIPQMPKESTKSMMIKPNAKATQNYSFVEDLVQSPCAMSAFEVLESCPA